TSTSVVFLAGGRASDSAHRVQAASVSRGSNSFHGGIEDREAGERGVRGVHTPFGSNAVSAIEVYRCDSLARESNFGEGAYSGSVLYAGQRVYLYPATGKGGAGIREAVPGGSGLRGRAPHHRTH